MSYIHMNLNKISESGILRLGLTKKGFEIPGSWVTSGFTINDIDFSYFSDKYVLSEIISKHVLKFFDNTNIDEIIITGAPIIALKINWIGNSKINLKLFLNSNYKIYLNTIPKNADNTYTFNITNSLIESLANQINKEEYYDCLKRVVAAYKNIIGESTGRYGVDVYPGFIFLISHPAYIKYSSASSNFPNIERIDYNNFYTLKRNVNYTYSTQSYVDLYKALVLGIAPLNAKKLNGSSSYYLNLHNNGEGDLLYDYESLTRLSCVMSSVHASTYKNTKIHLPKRLKDLYLYNNCDSQSQTYDDLIAEGSITFTNNDDINCVTPRIIDEINRFYNLDSFCFNCKGNMLDLSKVTTINERLRHLDLCGIYIATGNSLEQVKRIWPNISSLVVYDMTYNGETIEYKDICDKMPNLKSLTIYHNKSNPTAHSSMPNVEKLFIGGNSFQSEILPYHINTMATNYVIKQFGHYSASISPESNITDASIIFSKMPNLEALNFKYYEDIDDFRFFSNANYELAALTMNLDFSNITITNTKLKALGFEAGIESFNNTNTLKHIAEIFPNLEYLKLSIYDNYLPSLEDLKYFTNLRFLALSFKNAATITTNNLSLYQIESLPNVEFFYSNILWYQTAESDRSFGEIFPKLQYMWGYTQGYDYNPTLHDKFASEIPTLRL